MTKGIVTKKEIKELAKIEIDKLRTPQQPIFIDQYKLLENVFDFGYTQTMQSIELLIDIIKPLYEAQDQTFLGKPPKYIISER